MLGEEEEEEEEGVSVPRFRVGAGEDGEGKLEDSVLIMEAREEELEDSTLGVRLRGLRRRVCCAGGAAKA